MDQRFEQVTDKMDGLIKESSDLFAKVTKRFDEVDKTQSKLQQQTKSIEDRLASAIQEFQSSVNKLFTEFRQENKENAQGWKKSIEEAREAANGVQKEYEDKVQYLINSIDEKSQNILSMHSELVAIKNSQKKAETQFNALAEDQIKQISELKKVKEDMLHNKELTAQKKLIDGLSARLEKLEKHAHTHIFGGSKI